MRRKSSWRWIGPPVLRVAICERKCVMRHSLADRRCDGAREELNNFRRTLVAVLWIGNILPLDDRKSYPPLVCRIVFGLKDYQRRDTSL